MNLSFQWLREFVPFDGTPAQLSDLLTFAGVEVEDVRNRGVDIPQVVVAQILESKQHPNADRLSVCQVDDGSGQPRQIVCGAKNYRVGDKVPLALPGAVLPGDFKIKEGKLRGEKSSGMLCSARELGLGDDQSGLLILPAEAKVGAPMAELYPAETIFEIEITPNRPDLLSHVGVGREISALTGRALTAPPAEAPVTAGDAGIGVRILAEAREACPYYTATRIDEVKVGPSPAWLRDRLESVGLRSINNVVDVTNYVMLELGQPLHAFDLAKVGGGGIEVRLGRAGEKFHALDGRHYELQPHHCVIGDFAGEADGLGGVMGGEGSGVTPAATSIVLEAAYFRPTLIRRTSRELGLSSDASYRFERGVDAAGIRRAAARATALILQVAGGTARPLVEVGDVSELTAPRTVGLRHARLEALMGIAVEPARVDAILTALGLSKVAEGWSVPSFRRDLEREVDLIEEIVRVIGLDAVPGRAQGRIAPSSETDRAYDAGMALRRTLAGLGFSEARSLSLIAARDVPAGAAVLSLKNPLNEDQVALRPTLLTGLLAAAARNTRAGSPDLRLFELGRIFPPGTPAGQREPLRLALLLTGSAAPASWRGGAARALDLHDLQAVLERLLPPGARLAVERTERAGYPLAVELKLDGRVLGFAGQLEKAQADALDLRAAVFAAELDADLLLAQTAAQAVFQPLDRFPAVTRDIALLVDRSVTHASIHAALRAAQEPLLTAVTPFDIFTDPTGAKIPAEKKSVAYSLTYRAPDRTLTTDEVNAAHSRVKSALAGGVAVQFRE
ncbi:MAG: phenylalanine--tRNA ligase subunit beta [Verrucomicrobia bacterium]|nr:phenylalanine--tRNA ligase subunit beta [Verrucomicrobiota bacterium]